LAFCTTMSSRPQRSTAAWTAPRTASASPTSTSIAMALPPSAAISATVSSQVDRGDR
jgi:hypothetical protein